jgi:hypothetical protein
VDDVRRETFQSACIQRIGYAFRVGLFNRKKPELRPCPQCGQLLAADVLVCDMCDLDMREAQPAPTGTAPSGDAR